MANNSTSASRYHAKLLALGKKVAAQEWEQEEIYDISLREYEELPFHATHDYHLYDKRHAWRPAYDGKMKTKQVWGKK